MVSAEAATCPSCGINSPARKKTSTFALLALIVFGVFVGLQIFGKSENYPTYRPPEVPKRPPAADAVRIVKWNLTRGGFDNVLLGTFTLKNDNPYAVKDFQIVCGQFAASGTELPVMYAKLYQRLEAGQTKTFKDVNLGLMHSQARTYNCAIAVADQS